MNTKMMLVLFRVFSWIVPWLRLEASPGNLWIINYEIQTGRHCLAFKNN